MYLFQKGFFFLEPTSRNVFQLEPTTEILFAKDLSSLQDEFQNT